MILIKNNVGIVRECRHCDEAGPLKEMQEHVLNEHTPEGYHPYRCVACVEDFTRRVELLDHINRAHPKAVCESLITSKMAINWDVHLNMLNHEQSISFYGKEFQLPTPSGTEPQTPKKTKPQTQEKPEPPTEEMSSSPGKENSIGKPPKKLKSKPREGSSRREICVSHKT